jgi:hypothetical protein
MMTIRDVEANIIPACFTFDCAGFEVSCSTIARPNEILIFKKVGKYDRENDAVYRALSVEEAVAWCQRNQVKL